ncbi:hypothetical protein G8S49_06150 [Clostridium botulinum C]|uniref:Uncharacterized protein n=3 Tax=Clostridium TaxID=1485 RepID=A0A9Q4TLW6_CLOBO|nr:MULTISPECIES: hypothetical protein [Clostridium]NFD87623.1 hypothetical protein [Clostridium botulinum]KEI14155.1 hypothetical protein Z960_p0162 [Clostridium haemolyticum NCTC 9693]MCD3194790.1 hypothetical protein [Clostridium botulinum C]MCD3200275.1 hypothetical protein [Clostridium botulinum C]MCD3205658.1 hypothetical protein [Clostridium botulinum C]
MSGLDHKLFAIKDACNVFLKQKTKKGAETVLYSEYANTSELGFSSDRVYAKAKGVNKIAFDHNKKGHFKLEMEVFSLDWLPILLGGAFVEGDKEVMKREVLTVKDNSVTMTGTPAKGTLEVFLLNADGFTHKKKIDATTLASQGKYSISDKTLKFSSEDVSDGDKIGVYYLENKSKNVKSFTINAKKYPVNYEIFADTMLRNTEGLEEFIQLHIHNCKPKSNMTVNLDASNVAKINADFDLFADENDDMATYTIIE